MKKSFSLFVATFIAGFFVFGFGASVAHADGWSLAGSTSTAGTLNVAMPITDVQVTGGSTTTVPVKLRVTSGTLQMATTTGLTFTGSETGSTLYFSGTRDNVNAALASLTYTRNATGTDTLEVSLVQSGEVFFSENGHLYEYVSLLSTWDTAKTAAEARTKYGASGYLATIASSTENDFVAARLLNAGWMGASDSVSEGAWKWVTGPENGTQFWSGTAGGSTVGGQYANWSTGEPNDSSGEDCGQFLTGGSGKWNDLPCSSYFLPGYVVEYGAPGALPTVTAKNVAITTSDLPTVVSFSPADNATNVATSTNLTIVFSQAVTAGSGSLAVWDATDWLLVQPMIPRDDPAVSGLGTNTITINLTNDLLESNDYYVTIDSNTFKNAGNGYYVGSGATTTWSFRTGDFTAPTLSDISATSTSSTTATIEWTTNEDASSRVSYDSRLSTFSSVTSEFDTSPRVTAHTVTLTDLVPCTFYQYKVHSSDASANTATSSVKTFTTTGCIGSLTPTNRSVSNIDPASVSTNTLGWNSNVTVDTPALFTDASSTVSLQLASLSYAGVINVIGKPSASLVPALTDIFDIKALFDPFDLVNTFDVPVTVTMDYSDQDIAGIDESSLKIYHYHDDTWSMLTDCRVDTASNTVTCTTSNFSLFALFGTAAAVSASGQGASVGYMQYGCKDPAAKNYNQFISHKQSMCEYVDGSKSLIMVQTNSAKITSPSSVNLYLGIRNKEVVNLQKFLNAKGFVIAKTGAGSPGNETDMFGGLTKKALIKFQQANGISPAVGFYGPVTQAFIQSMK